MNSQLWFSKLKPEELCRLGGNGPKHPSQLYAIDKYLTSKNSSHKMIDMTFLDIGCGSGTTFEAMGILPKRYKGVDMIPANIEYCKNHFRGGEWEVQFAEFLKEPTESWDVVFSRHLLEHLSSFEIGLREHLRVARKLVIIVLWAELLNGDEDQIKHITEGKEVYLHEYTNRYSEANIKKTLNGLKEWELVEFTKGVGKEVFGNDTVIVLRRKDE